MLRDECQDKGVSPSTVMLSSPCLAFKVRQAESSLLAQLSVRARNMDFSLQVLSPQGIGDHDKEIWQATCLTYCQVSLTLSLLLLAASSLWLKLTRATALFLGEWRKIALENNKKDNNKKTGFLWLNIHHIHKPIRWSYSILFDLTIKGEKSSLQCHHSSFC